MEAFVQQAEREEAGLEGGEAQALLLFMHAVLATLLRAGCCMLHSASVLIGKVSPTVCWRPPCSS